MAGISTTTRGGEDAIVDSTTTATLTAEEEEKLEVETFYRDMFEMFDLENDVGVAFFDHRYEDDAQVDSLFWESREQALCPLDPVENRPLIPMVDILPNSEGELPLCVLCNVYVANTRLLPCRHVDCCTNCMARWRAVAPHFTCPSCRSTIKAVTPNSEFYYVTAAEKENSTEKRRQTATTSPLRRTRKKKSSSGKRKRSRTTQQKHK